MTLNLLTLRCAECGSGRLQRTGPNEYTCAHCGSVSRVEDDVSARLDQVLDQVKDAAADRLAAEQAARQRLAATQTTRIALIALGSVGIIVLAIAIASALSRPKRLPPVVSAPAVDRSIPVSGLKLGEPREVLVRRGGSTEPKLLVVARNETGKLLERPRIEMSYEPGEGRLPGRSESLPVDTLAPGESAPVLFDLPNGASPANARPKVQPLALPYRTADGPRLVFARMRLLQQGDDRLRLAGRIVNTRQDATLAGCEVLAMLYDDSGAVIGFASGSTRAGEIAPGQRASVDLEFKRFGKGAVAAWDYRIGYQVADGRNGRMSVLSPDRVVRIEAGPERLPDLHMSTEDLLADEAERFDLKQLALLPLIEGRDSTQRPVYFSEIVNRSSEAVALTPELLVTPFDGPRADPPAALGRVAYLYPGERLPVQLELRQIGRVTQLRSEWKPARRAALPGPRLPLEVKVSGTEAKIGHATVNFTQQFAFRYVEVRGTVRNPGTAIVRKLRLWVSLRDRDGRLTGFQKEESLPAIAPGDSIPFQVAIDQWARDFASVSVIYQTE